MGRKLFNHAQSKLSGHIEVLVNGTVYDAAEVFRAVNIQKPVHGFHISP